MCNYHPQQTLDAADDSFPDACEGSDEDNGADWFDLEALGLLDDLPTGEKFDFPVPTKSVSPMEHLYVEVFSGRYFYLDEEGYVQVYTQGECYNPFVDKPSIGVWFGPNHPL